MLATNNKTNRLLEQYLNYLSVMKGRSDNTIDEYRNDLMMFFRFIKKTRYPETEEFGLLSILLLFKPEIIPFFLPTNKNIVFDTIRYNSYRPRYAHFGRLTIMR